MRDRQPSASAIVAPSGPQPRGSFRLHGPMWFSSIKATISQYDTAEPTAGWTDRSEAGAMSKARSRGRRVSAWDQRSHTDATLLFSASRALPMLRTGPAAWCRYAPPWGQVGSLCRHKLGWCHLPGRRGEQGHGPFRLVAAVADLPFVVGLDQHRPASRSSASGLGNRAAGADRQQGPGRPGWWCRRGCAARRRRAAAGA
jgi:hypothetical protein